MGELTQPVRAFLEEPNCATIATLGADGSPHQAVIWFRLEHGTRILVNSRAGRRWPANLEGDRRCSLAIADRNDPFRWVGVQAEVTFVVDDSEAQEDIIAMSVHYGRASEAGAARFRTQRRVSFHLEIVDIHDNL